MPSEDYRPLSQGEAEGSSSQSRQQPPAPIQVPSRPPVYYNDGPFDPPSSEDEDDVDDITVYDEKTTTLHDEEEGLLIGKDLKKRSPLKVLLICLGGLLVMAALIGLFAATSYKGGAIREWSLGTKKLTMDDIFNGSFYVERKTLRWVPEAGDGVFSIEEEGALKLVDLKTNKTTELVKRKDIQDGLHREISWDEWKLSSDMRFVLVKTDRRKQWRYSSHGSYYVHDRTLNNTRAIAPPRSPPVIAYAEISPSSPSSVVFVQDNDLYILKLPAARDVPVRITKTGSKTVFNGVPDWVYEEEVFGGDKAFWFSPNSKYLAFLSFDETAVEEYTFPIYNPGSSSADINPYTTFTTMKYPKPGYSNPVVSLFIYDLDDLYKEPVELNWENRRPRTDSIISEVVWIGNSSLIIKELDRSGSAGTVVYFDLAEGTGGDSAKGKVVRKLGKEGEHGDEGWIECAQNVRPLKKSSGYLDLVPTKDGYMHIAYFSSADSGEPKFITNGKWEVTDGIGGIDEENGKVFFTAANPSSIQRHVFSAPLSGTGEVKSLTDTKQLAYYSASFSPQGGFYNLGYNGPNIPYQKVLNVQNASFEHILTENAQLNKTASQYVWPTVVRGTMMSDGYELNTIELRPPNFDDSGRTKYPVFFQVYGGPGSQMVDTKWAASWHEFLCTTLKYIIVRVDGRGTGFKGRKLRNPVKGDLGKHEVIDQVAAAKLWSEKIYVDRSRIGIWGWSYGGFMTAKIAEAAAGYHKLAISVAPVTDWRLYDSIYTERYMGRPEDNLDGYDVSGIANVTGFDQIDYALAHGSGDDNVHYANTAHLLDLFTTNGIRKYRFRMFTDSDHSMSKRGAYRELHEWLTAFLKEKWGHGALQKAWRM